MTLLRCQCANFRVLQANANETTIQNHTLLRTESVAHIASET